MRLAIITLILCAAVYAGGPDKPKGADDGNADYTPVVYKGAERTRDWFNKMHRKFKGKIGRCDGKFYDLTMGLDGLPKLWKGNEGRIPGDVSYIAWDKPLPIKWQYLDVQTPHILLAHTVGEVCSSSDVIVKVQQWSQDWEEGRPHGKRKMRRTPPKNTGGGVTCTISGLDTSKLKAGDPIGLKKPLLVVCTGPNAFKAIDTSPLSKEEFRAAIESGFELAETRKTFAGGKWTVKRVVME